MRTLDRHRRIYSDTATAGHFVYLFSCDAQIGIVPKFRQRDRKGCEVGLQLRRLPHVRTGVGVGDQSRTFRAEHLRGTGAKVKFFPTEPILESVGSPDLES